MKLTRKDSFPSLRSCRLQRCRSLSYLISVSSTSDARKRLSVYFSSLSALSLVSILREYILDAAYIVSKEHIRTGFSLLPGGNAFHDVENAFFSRVSTYLNKSSGDSSDFAIYLLSTAEKKLSNLTGIDQFGLDENLSFQIDSRSLFPLVVDTDSFFEVSKFNLQTR